MQEEAFEVIVSSHPKKIVQKLRTKAVSLYKTVDTVCVTVVDGAQNEGESLASIGTSGDAVGSGNMARL